MRSGLRIFILESTRSLSTSQTADLDWILLEMRREHSTRKSTNGLSTCIVSHFLRVVNWPRSLLVGNIRLRVCSEVSIWPSSRNYVMTVIQGTLVPRIVTYCRAPGNSLSCPLRNRSMSSAEMSSCDILRVKTSDASLSFLPSYLKHWEGCCIHPFWTLEPCISLHSLPTRPWPRHPP